MKRVYFYIVLVIFSSQTACKKDFLEVVDKTVLLKEGYVIDLETTGQFLNGTYVDIGAYYINGSYLPYPEIMADNMKPAKIKTFSSAYNWDFSSVSKEEPGDPVIMWRRLYNIIRNCSFIINKADEYHEQNPEVANNLKGQALAIRAMMHFTLVNIFAQSYNYSSDASHPGIPYIETSDLEPAVYRKTVSEVYSAMINDLTNALQLLPTAVMSKDLMNYQAAKALLSRIYLFKSDYAKSKDLAVQVLKDVPLMTNNYPANLYTTNDTEALFWMAPGASATDNYYAVFTGYYSTKTGGEFFYVATNDIAQLLQEDPNDKRKNWVKKVSLDWYINKFPTGITKKFPIADGDYYQTLFRSSEMCLNAAETYAKLNMEDSARYYIDAIRKRANPTLSSINAQGTALLDSIYKERRKEMAFDGFRMFDLQRWKIGVNRLDASSPNVQNLPYPSDKAIAALPKQDVELSGLPQNPGY
jgi:hypothetical protein